jgi:hypothetical protein
MKKEELLVEANEITRTFYSIIKRKGKSVNWEDLSLKVQLALKKQNEFLNEKSSTCEHKYVYSRSIEYLRSNGRNSREYYHADYYFCEKYLEEKVIEKRHSCYDSEVWCLPEWAKVITNKTRGYE